MIPDLVNCKFGPVRELDVLGNFFLELHHLLFREQLLHEEESAVVFPRQKEALKGSGSESERGLTVFSERYL